MRPTLLLMLAIGLVGSNSLVLAPLAQEVAASFPGRAPEEIMTAAAVYGGGVAVSALLLAPQADRIGLRNALVLALAVLTGAMALSAAAPSFTVLALAQALTGIAAGICLPATYGLAAEIAPAGRESETLGKVIFGWTISLVSGVTLSAILADHTHWRLVFVILATLGLLITAALWRFTAPSGPGRKPVSPLTALRIPGVIPGLLAISLNMLAFYGFYSYVGAHFTGTLGLSTSMAGVFTLSYGIGFGMAMPLDRLVDRFGAARATPPVLAGLILVYIAFGITINSPAGLLGFAFTWGIAQHLGLNLLVGRLAAICPERRGAIMGLNSSATYIAMFAGTAGFRPVFVAGGLTATSFLAAAVLLPALWLALRADR